jgi:hypothetical protein
LRYHFRDDGESAYFGSAAADTFDADALVTLDWTL